MTKSEFQTAFAIAADSQIDLSSVDDEILYGCGLPDFEPVVATYEAVAKMIRWQAHCIDGSWDQEELTSLRNCFRRRVTVCGHEATGVGGFGSVRPPVC